MNKKIDYSLYVVTDRELSLIPTPQVVEQAILGGATMIQLREKDCDSLTFYNVAKEVKDICDKYGVMLIINDRVDIALAVNADGVHVGQGDIPAKVVRQMIGEKMLLGVSARTLLEAENAIKDGADYLGVGAMKKTSTKTDAVIVSKEELKKITELNIPIVLIGGINIDTIEEFGEFDIDGIAVVSCVVAKENIKESAKQIKEKFLSVFPPIIRNKKAVLFDMDGTIVKSLDIWRKIDDDFFYQRKLVADKDYYQNINTLSIYQTGLYTKEKYNLAESVEEIVEGWLSQAEIIYTNQLKIENDVRKYLRELKNKGFKIAMVTASNKRLYMPFIKSNSLEEFFDVCVDVEEVNKGKHFPDAFLLGAEKLGVSAEDCVVFDDDLNALKGAKSGGFTTVAVNISQRTLHEVEKQAIADFYITDYNYAPKIK